MLEVLMKTLIIYDSLYGNTEKVAQAIKGALTGEVIMQRMTEANLAELQPGDLLIIGSPTQGGTSTKVTQEFLKNITGDNLKNIRVGVFDTRLTQKMVGIFGYAAGKIGDILKKKGVSLVGNPVGFYVKGSKGPLKEGELERVTDWVKNLNTSR